MAIKKKTNKRQIELLKKRLIRTKESEKFYINACNKFRKENCELEEEILKYRVFIASKMKWFLELLEQNKTPKMSWLVKNTVEFLQTVKKFDW